MSTVFVVRVLFLSGDPERTLMLPTIPAQGDLLEFKDAKRHTVVRRAWKIVSEGRADPLLYVQECD